ncbi:FCP1 [Symbiodinium microadriaticum]|nr:FCP1 [Symbiodinium microadriaticum]
MLGLPDLRTIQPNPGFLQRGLEWRHRESAGCKSGLYAQNQGGHELLRARQGSTIAAAKCDCRGQLEQQHHDSFKREPGECDNCERPQGGALKTWGPSQGGKARGRMPLRFPLRFWCGPGQFCFRRGRGEPADIPPLAAAGFYGFRKKGPTGYGHVQRGMCVQCHRIVSTAPDKAKAMQRPGFLTTAVDLQVSASLLSSLDADEQVRRASERKLVLVMDLDHTLVTADMRGMPSKMKIRKRPGVDDFLQVTRDTCEIYVYTQATGAYAQKVLEILDPDRRYFGDPPRIFHRENTPQGFKDLSQILPKDATSALIVDDREEVWPVVVRQSQLLKGDARQHLDFEGKLTGATAADPSTASFPWSELGLCF